MFCLASKYQEVHVFAEICMPHAMQIRQTGGPEVLNWTAVDVGEPGSGQVRLRQAAAGLNYIDVYHRTGYYPQPLPFIPGLEGAGTVEAVALPVVFDSVGKDTFLRSLDCLRPRGLMVTFGQASGPIDPIAPVLLSQKGSLFLTRPILFHYIQRRDALEASAKELFEVVASGKVRINVNQRFALKDAADAHKALEARATSGSTILTI
jgi:NADPH:quinone reductase-like Zn-dependent oxidoreductase